MAHPPTYTHAHPFSPLSRDLFVALMRPELSHFLSGGRARSYTMTLVQLEPQVSVSSGYTRILM